MLSALSLYGVRLQAALSHPLPDVCFAGKLEARGRSASYTGPMYGTYVRLSGEADHEPPST